MHLHAIVEAVAKIDVDGRELLKMSELAQRSGTPAATLKHYVREGLIDAALRTTKNSALYDAALVPRIRRIKELQRTKFLPLRVIKELLEGGAGLSDDATIAAAIGRVLEREGLGEKRTRAQVLAGGLPEAQLAWLEATGLVRTHGRERVFTGDDLALLRLLGAARGAGLTPEMLPFDVLESYVRAIRDLVRAELEIFRRGVLPRAKSDLPRLTEAAAQLSESLVVLLRRKLLLPTLAQIVEEEERPKSLKSKRSGRSRPT